jgi:glutamate---cysteine ligase / carboxylate-amine ligase
VIPHAFGESAPWSVGIEEEVFVLDAETLEPRPFPRGSFDPPRLKQELFASVVELNTGICGSVADAVAELAGLRAEAKSRAADAGLVLAACGTWPTAAPEEQPFTPDRSYQAFVEYAGVSARRQFCSGVHVHVGVPSPDECMRLLEAVLPWLPLVLAVSASSPYVAGTESGLASARAEILALLPRAGAPPVFASYAEWETFAERLVTLGLADEYTRIWWDVRPHPRYGTLEVRMPDQPTTLEATAALARLVHGLVRSLGARIVAGDPAENEDRSRQGDEQMAADRGVYAENRWAALRFGRDARLIHPVGHHLATVPELLEELSHRVGSEAVDGVRGLDQAGEQLAVGRAEGLETLCRRLVELT